MNIPFVSKLTSFYRPVNTTVYSIGDTVANNATAGLVEALALRVENLRDNALLEIERLRVITSDTGFQEIAVRAWLFGSSPQADGGIAAGDNAAISLKRKDFLGRMSGILSTFSDGSGGILTPDDGTRIVFRPTGAVVFAVLETLSAVTPSANSTLFESVLEGMQSY